MVVGGCATVNWDKMLDCILGVPKAPIKKDRRIYNPFFYKQEQITIL